LARMVENVANVVGIELITVAQGCDFHAPLKSSTRLERVRALIRARIPRLTNDRYLAPDIAAATDLVSSGALLASAGADDLPTLEGATR
jgi:histidine ammonia-lyase